ncbi:MAG TPA: FG-GAP repeat protein, partial [Nitrospiria bacterium]|nr:FG-GAP repeat protein [Nitrospiria bacterium]
YAGDGFGRMVKIIKDADGDGFSDFLIGAPFSPAGIYPGVGQAHLYLGGQGLTPTTQMTLSSPINSTNAYFGFSAAAMGEIATKDGYADWVIGAWGGTSVPNTYPGWAAVYKGNPTLFTNQPLPAFNIYSGNSSQNEGFSVALSSPGDFNGDGIPDLIVGAMYANQADGAAYFYDGHFASPPLPNTILGGPTGAKSGFGYDVH